MENAAKFLAPHDPAYKRAEARLWLRDDEDRHVRLVQAYNQVQNNRKSKALEGEIASAVAAVATLFVTDFHEHPIKSLVLLGTLVAPGVVSSTYHLIRIVSSEAPLPANNYMTEWNRQVSSDRAIWDQAVRNEMKIVPRTKPVLAPA